MLRCDCCMWHEQIECLVVVQAMSSLALHWLSGDSVWFVVPFARAAASEGQGHYMVWVCTKYVHTA